MLLALAINSGRGASPPAFSLRRLSWHTEPAPNEQDESESRVTAEVAVGVVARSRESELR